jgi:hypothetical protein
MTPGRVGDRRGVARGLDGMENRRPRLFKARAAID